MANNVNWKHLTLELFVVFLGVTAGFILNNWRGNINERKQEHQYLQGFMEDIQSNRESLAESIEMDSLWLKRARPLITLMIENKFHADSSNTIMELLSTYTRFGARIGTWEAILNSGNLNLISDFQLKKQIVDYHMSIETVEFIDDYLFDVFDRNLNTYLISEYSFINNQIINLGIGITPEFANIFAVYFSLLQQRYGSYKSIFNESDSLQVNLANKLN